MEKIITFLTPVYHEISILVLKLVPTSISRVFWQIGFILLSLLLAYIISKKVNNYIKTHALSDHQDQKNHDHTIIPFKEQVQIFISEMILRSSFPIIGLIFLTMSYSFLHVANQGTRLFKIVIPLLISLIAIRLFIYLLRQSIARHNALLIGFEKFISVVVWSVSALYITGTLSKFISLLEDFNITLGKTHLSLLSIFQAIIVISVVLLITLWVNRIIEVQLTQNQHIDLNFRVMLNKLSKALMFVIATMIALPLAGIDLTVLSVFGGALGVGLGFGLQKIASNYISGFIILMDKSIKIGDMVTIDNHYGQVTQLNARYIVIRDYSNVEFIIPNETLIGSTVTNHSYSDKSIRVAISFGVSYNSNVDQVKKIVLDIVHKIPRVLKSPEPQVFIKQLGNSSIDFELFVWIGDLELGYMLLKSKVYEQILEEFKKNNIEIPFPQQDVYIKNQS